jgi:DNA helicase-2/ATP-dependent DNA helicase PcrA
MEEAMLRYGMPYKIVGGIKFYARKEVKDLIAYLRVIQNPADTVSLLRIINTPPRKIGPKTLEGIQNYAFAHKLTFFQAMQDVENIPEISGPKAESIKAFVGMIKDLQKVNGEFPASGLIKHVIDSTGYKRFLDDGTTEGEARVENTYELINVASKYDNLEPALSLNIFLEEIALISDLDGLDTQDNAVTLMTIHSAKGLEFSVVFIVGLEEGVLPHSRSLLDREELEEERRLMYVAITRAKDKLYLTHSRSRMVYGEMQNNTASQFIQDLPDEVLESDPGRTQRKLHTSDISYTPIPYEEYPEEAGVELHDGDRVYHQTFGEGTVVNVTGGVATVAFKNVRYGVKKLALSVAPLKKIDD